MSQSLRAVVIGASGMGKHHAKWLHQHGAHVMCEKPLVQDWDKSNEQLLAEAQDLAQAADEAGVVAAVNTQYVTAAEAYQDLAEQVGISALVSPPKSFFMQIESRGGEEGTDYEQIWIDLAPHPLSVLRAMLGPGQIDPESQRVCVARKWVDAHFDLIPDDGGPPVRAHILVRNVPAGPLTRRLGINDLLADYEGRNNAEGVYASFLTLCGVERESADFVKVSLSRFIQAVRGEGESLATFADGVTDLERLLGLLGVAERTPE